MDYELEVRYPTYETTTVTAQDLPAIYAKVQAPEQPTFTWNPEGEDSVTVVVGDDFAYITLLHDGGFYTLVVSEDDEDVVLVIGDNDTAVQRKALAPREVGLAVLQRASDIPGLLTAYTWEEE